MSLIVDEHREYLADPLRLELFRRALAESVHAGAIVADIGSGTGILGLLACAAGAGRVYAIEATGMIEIGRALAAANGMADRFIPIHAHSSDVELPERVDVCVSDFVGRFGFDAGIFEIYPPARTRLLKPGGTLIPFEISLFVAPVERLDADARVRFWLEPRSGIDVAPAFEWAVNTGYPVMFEARDVIGEPVEAVTASTAEMPPAGFRAAFEMTISRSATLHGLGGWCSARLSPGVTMTNSPFAPDRIRRRNVFLPLRHPLSVAEGDRLNVRLSILPADLIVGWSVEVVSARGGTHARQAHSTLKGMLLGRDDLTRSRPDFIPSLTPRGMARLTTLQLCDGRRPLSEVEAQVFRRHSQLFASSGEAAAFVAEVVSRYSTVPARDPRT